MAISVSNQAYIFLCSVISGMLIAFIYDIFRIKRKTVKTNRVATGIEDLLYWIIVALVVFGVVYYSNDGELRGYIFIGNIIGVILYILVFSKIIMKLFMAILKIISRVLKTVVAVLIYPLRIIYKIFAVPLRFLFKHLLSLFRGAKRTGKTRLARTAIWSKRLKNIRKKI